MIVVCDYMFFAYLWGVLWEGAASGYEITNNTPKLIPQNPEWVEVSRNSVFELFDTLG